MLLGKLFLIKIFLRKNSLTSHHLRSKSVEHSRFFSFKEKHRAHRDKRERERGDEISPLPLVSVRSVGSVVFLLRRRTKLQRRTNKKQVT